MDDSRRFVAAQTRAGAPPLVPEVRLHLATEVTPLWEATEAFLERVGLPPPYWAFAWPGGQALARYILDNPTLVAGLRVIDFAAGCGVAAISALMAGAARAIATDLDSVACVAAGMNAAMNGVLLEVTTEDRVGNPCADADVILAGDICYERDMADRMVPWLRDLAGRGKLVLLGDPGRSYVPRSGLTLLGRYTVPTSRDLEDRDQRETMVWRLESRA